jgi:hypothetical protein
MILDIILYEVGICDIHDKYYSQNLSTSNKLLIYKTILKPIWIYGIQLWGPASISNR